MYAFLKKILGTKHQRDVRKLRPQVERINAYEQEYQSLSDEQLRAKTEEFKQRLRDGETLDDICFEAFAVVKNACRRLVGRKINVCGHEQTWDMIPFDVQIIGGLVLHQGKIAEMATGEGKTLVATMPLYLNALTGRNVNLVTVNDYLARRDAEWMGAVYEFLGLTVGCLQNTMTPAERRAEYACDITYGTNSEFGFDYLRDNGMAFRSEDQVQRDYAYAIVDEIDSILIDEARTPLIISGPVPVSTHQYFDLKPKVERLIRRQQDLCTRLIREARELLEAGETEQAQLLLYQVHQGMPKNKQLLHMLEDASIRHLLERINDAMLTDMRKEQARELREELYFTIEERAHEASLTEKGCAELNPADPEAYVLPDLATLLSELDGDTDLDAAARTRRRQEIQDQFAERAERIHNVDQLIKAYSLYEKDVHYVVQNNQVLIVDEFTGRILPGRRWSDGLHQAVEAREGVKIERETQTLATITIQNYFRMYDKLAGMTGTAETEADEFHQIYKLDVVMIPTNRPVRRMDSDDCIYRTQREKYKAIIEEISDCHRRGQPVLVGTVSVDASELLSRMLRRVNIQHSVLNAKNHEREAEIVRNAGQVGAVTIATNMAGRGTDIKLAPAVLHLERGIVTSNLELDDRVDGRTLRSLLEEKPSGLHVLGTERHESRRIDRQLRGRCARQGDPGSSQFYVSLEDDLMRLFGSERLAGVMQKLGVQEGDVLQHSWLNRTIENAQRRVEQQNFSIRKRTLEYDDVMNKQREVIYSFRGEIVRTEQPREMLLNVLEDVILSASETWLADSKQPDIDAFVSWATTEFPVTVNADELRAAGDDADDMASLVFERVREAYLIKMTDLPEQGVSLLERQIMLGAIDSHWQEYLRGMDSLRQGVGLRAYGQRDPLVEYKREAFDMFATLMTDIKQDIVNGMFRTTIRSRLVERVRPGAQRRYVHDDVQSLGTGVRASESATASTTAGGGRRDGDTSLDNALRQAEPVRREAPKVGRNAPCPCGSGKKYKKCCGAM